MIIKYDQQTCSRCGGSGSYSWCQTYGSTCFRCGGRGTVTTRQGRKAAELVNEALTVPVEDIKVGDIIMDYVITMNGPSTKKFRHVVQNITTSYAVDKIRYSIETMRKNEKVTFIGHSGSKYRMAFTSDMEERVKEALTVRGGKLMKGVTIE